MPRGIYNRKIERMNKKQIEYFREHSKPRWVIKDLNNNVIELFRCKDTANNEINELKKRHGELRIELIENG